MKINDDLTPVGFGVNQPRFYRLWVKKDNLFSFEVKVKETDLHIRASRDLRKETLEAIKKHRSPIEDFIRLNPEFKKTLAPYHVPEDAAPVIKDMVLAAKKVGVGPMAAVAGTIAEYVGRDLLKQCEEVIVENGGDIFIKVKRPVKIGIYAADSPFTEKIALSIKPQETPLGICTSSGSVGHSLSLGESDAVIVLAKSAIFADACATAIGNLVKNEKDISAALKYAKEVKGIYGIVLIKGQRIGAWGKVQFSDK